MKHAVLCVVITCATAAVYADIGPAVDVPTRARGAGRIVVGRVIDVIAQFETNRFGDQLIVSHAVVDVAEILKGAPATTVRVDVEGGTVGDLTLKVSDLPAVRTGDRAVFFLDQGVGDSYLPHLRGKGILKLAENDVVEGSTLTLAELRQQVRGALGLGGR
jgi:hypothetical protein